MLLSSYPISYLWVTLTLRICQQTHLMARVVLWKWSWMTRAWLWCLVPAVTVTQNHDWLVPLEELICAAATFTTRICCPVFEDSPIKKKSHQANFLVPFPMNFLKCLHRQRIGLCISNRVLFLSRTQSLLMEKMGKRHLLFFASVSKTFRNQLTLEHWPVVTNVAYTWRSFRLFGFEEKCVSLSEAIYC